VAVDYGILRENLRQFYDFCDKAVLYVGAGGRQLLDPAIKTKRLVAIDQNALLLEELKASVAADGRANVEVMAARFEDVSISADVVYFEFCLHEMNDPEEALRRARRLAADTVVFDHMVGSEWIFLGAEEDKVRRSATAIEQFGFRRRERFLLAQQFSDHNELLAKLNGQGALAIERAQRFAGATDISIPMPYELILL